MRVIVIGGLASSLVNFRGPLLKALVERGHEVLACAPAADDSIQSELAQWGVEYRHVPMARASMGRNRDRFIFPLRPYLPGIIASVLEGMNNRIKVIKRTACR